MSYQDSINFLPIDNHRLNNLCGACDENITQIANACDVRISRHSSIFTVSSKTDPNQVKHVIKILDHFYQQSKRELLPEHIQLGLIEFNAFSQVDVELINEPQAKHSPYHPKTVILKTKRRELSARTPRQDDYLSKIQQHDITFGIGPAGTGKTYLAVACAVDALERELVKRIVLVRPAVEAGEKLGFLPGDLTQKVDPYLRPLYDALYDLMGGEKMNRLMETNVIEVAPLAFMRGRTLNHCFIILDEAQNTTPEQMKMFLTRIGFGSKAVVTGDVTQIDLQRGQKSGLVDAQKILKSVKGLAFMNFKNEDVVRHPLVQQIVNAYDKYKASQQQNPSIDYSE